MNDNQKVSKNKLNWQPAAEIFGEVSTWVVVPVILALVFGKMLDTHFGTKPVIFLALTGLSFVLSCYGIVRVVTRYMKTLEKEIENNKDADKTLKN